MEKKSQSIYPSTFFSLTRFSPPAYSSCFILHFFFPPFHFFLSFVPLSLPFDLPLFSSLPSIFLFSLLSFPPFISLPFFLILFRSLPFPSQFHSSHSKANGNIYQYLVRRRIPLSPRCKSTGRSCTRY